MESDKVTTAPTISTTTMAGIFTLDTNNPAVQQFVFYSSILIFKMLLMSLFTAMRRIMGKAWAAPEDAKFFTRGQDDQIKLDVAVERVRRAHQNDLENIPTFILIAGLYLLTDPSGTTMSYLMKIFTAMRIVHTLVYAFREVPQPIRAVVWAVGYAIAIYMACVVFYHFI